MFLKDFQWVRGREISHFIRKIDDNPPHINIISPIGVDPVREDIPELIRKESVPSPAWSNFASEEMGLRREVVLIGNPSVPDGTLVSHPAPLFSTAPNAAANVILPGSERYPFRVTGAFITVIYSMVSNTTLASIITELPDATLAVIEAFNQTTGAGQTYVIQRNFFVPVFSYTSSTGQAFVRLYDDAEITGNLTLFMRWLLLNK